MVPLNKVHHSTNIINSLNYKKCKKKICGKHKSDQIVLSKIMYSDPRLLFNIFPMKYLNIIYEIMNEFIPVSSPWKKTFWKIFSKKVGLV